MHRLRGGNEIKYQYGLPGWDGAKVNRLLSVFEGDEGHDMTSDAAILELYRALRWTYDEYRVLRSIVGEIKTIVAPETIPTIDAPPFE